MTTPKFIQLHWLASYPGALLNRDDAGLAKRLPFGGATRTRVSSQCLKRHWRMAEDGLHMLAKGQGIESERSKVAIEMEVTGPLRADHPSEVVDAIEKVFVKHIYGSKAKAIPGGWEDMTQQQISKGLGQRQALLLGRPELSYLRDYACNVAIECDRDAEKAKEMSQAFFDERNDKKNIAQFQAQAGFIPFKKVWNADEWTRKKEQALAAGLESALFGRMVTSDIRANTDAAIHVAHAFTVHAEQAELDYFTVVDDLARREDAGAGGIFDTELTSGLYYGYVVVDVPLLVSNLTGCDRKEWAAEGLDRDLAARVVENLVHLIATVTPGAKKGSTAPYAYADLVLAEMGERQPRTLANAFRDPVQPPSMKDELARGDTLAGRTSVAIAKELDGLDKMFGAGDARVQAARGDAAIAGVETMPLADLARRVGEAIRTAALPS